MVFAFLPLKLCRILIDKSISCSIFLDLAGFFAKLNKSLFVVSMHDTHLLKSILKYFEDQEKSTSKRIKKVYFSISEFGSLNKKHFIQHYKESVHGTKWQDLETEIRTIPFGPELEITGLEFGRKTEEEKK